ncbi:unnamed protein product [Prunus brigantina]
MGPGSLAAAVLESSDFSGFLPESLLLCNCRLRKKKKKKERKKERKEERRGRLC